MKICTECKLRAGWGAVSDEQVNTEKRAGIGESRPVPSTVASDGPAPDRGLAPAERKIFLGLLLGMFVAALSQMMVGPAIPLIIAELGGMEHYSWVATAAMLTSAATVPVVGKLSDMYGRRPFYIAGLMVFMAGAVVGGLANSFWLLVMARAIQGMGMGTIMPLAQTIVGDIVPARYRGKYQGYMGAVFGVCSVIGPLVGGVVTDWLGWRYLFFLAVPIGLVAMVPILRFLHVPHHGSPARLDLAGFILLPSALTMVLLATSMGGTTWAWGSPQIIGLFAGGAVVLALFVMNETRAAEPVLPLRLFRSRTFVLGNLASLAVSMGMFGVMIYVPVFVQGVIGLTPGGTGLVLMPQSVLMITMSIVVGHLIARTGRYRIFTLVGACVMLLGIGLLAWMPPSTGPWALAGIMMVFGVGLGSLMQVFVLLVQNDADRRDLGVVTSAAQFFRNVGSTLGITIFGAVMSTRMADAIARHLPPGAAGAGPQASNAGAVLDPAQLEGVPPQIVEAIRLGVADSLHGVFLAVIPTVFIVLVATVFIPHKDLADRLQPLDGESPGEDGAS